jgi:hypothetical protein
MIQSKLDAFKAKANSVLMAEALLYVNGGDAVTTQDPEHCHLVNGKRKGKANLTNYSQCQLDHFFADFNFSTQFDSMYAAGDVNLANQRLQFMDHMIAQG